MEDNSFKMVDVTNKQSIGVVGDVEEGIESDDDKPKPEKDDDATEIDESNVTGWQFGQRIQVFSSLGVGIARCRFLGRSGSLLWLACHSSWELLIFKLLVQNHQSFSRLLNRTKLTRRSKVLFLVCVWLCAICDFLYVCAARHLKGWIRGLFHCSGSCYVRGLWS